MGTDDSNQAIAGIVSLHHIVNGGKQLHPVEYDVKTLSAGQHNWAIHDKGLFAIVDILRKWRDWLVGVEVNVHTDHQGLQYFNTKQKLFSRQASCCLHMSKFRYHIYYRPTTKMGKPDGQSSCEWEEISGMHAKFVEEVLLLDLREDENDNQGNADDI